MAEEKYLHSELTGKIIGCAMEVRKALDIEMAEQGLTARRKDGIEFQ